MAVQAAGSSLLSENLASAMGVFPPPPPPIPTTAGSFSPPDWMMIGRHSTDPFPLFLGHHRVSGYPNNSNNDISLVNGTSLPDILPSVPLSSSSPATDRHFHQLQQQLKLYAVAGPPPPGFSDDDEFEKQRREIDFVIRHQNERLRRTIEHHSNRQLAGLLRRFESRAGQALRKADEELVSANRKTVELEQRLRRAEMESDAWQRIAKENESMAVGLSAMLDQVRREGQQQQQQQQQQGHQVAEDDAESVCDCGERGYEEEKDNNKKKEVEEEGEGERKKKEKWCCKWCGLRVSCVVFLPCKHLCACASCGPALAICPLCHSVKEACVQVILPFP